MRMPRPLVLLLACLISPAALLAQESSSPAPTTTPGPQTPQAASILQQSLRAMTGGSAVTDVTMIGTEIVTIGSTSESGTIKMIATSSGQGELAVSLPSDTRTEIRTVSTSGSTLTEIGGDGVPHAVHTQSTLSPHPAWFYPALVLASGLSSPQYSSSYIGEETRNGAAVQHLTVSLVSTLGSSVQGNLQALTQYDVYLDSSSLLPVAMAFTAHPYDPANPDRQLIPDRTITFDHLEEVRYSDYRVIQGLTVAFHIQTILNIGAANLISDIQVSSVTFNTGVVVAANN